MRIILSRTDSIGDVVLTLPVAGVLKERFPGSTIIFIGRSYTRPVIEQCRYVDQFVDWDEIRIGSSRTKFALLRIFTKCHAEGPAAFLASLRADVIVHVFPVRELCKAAKMAGIPWRIGTSHRFFTWFTCNRLVHLSRRKSVLHEAQLNLKLLEPLGIRRDFSLQEIPGYYGLTGRAARNENYSGADGSKKGLFNLIIHPKSKGSAREWGLENFGKLIDLLPADRFNILVTGTAAEGERMRDFLHRYRDRITDLTGRLSLSELIALISRSDGFVSASTGPLHLAAALGIRAVGLYAPMRPIFPQRWAPLGERASFLVLNKKCDACRHSGDCSCIRSITPAEVFSRLIK
ncbi:MAG: lipopolysaccharide heptosyltransferase family protein [Alphaproteobacteria bacterium]|nr:lipopolysaccharide heptosyltransferase family protein [Alphaproteobacteria bacterium]